MVEVLYHVDRKRALTAGQVLELEPLELGDKGMDFHLGALFPDGITEHGHRYLATEMQAEPEYEGMLAIELILEYVRRACYPNRPSRYQSVFAASSYDDALLFASQLPATDEHESIPIWEVSAQTVFRADMSLLGTFHNGTVWSLAAHLYWNGEEGHKHGFPPQPTWEYLLVPPVTVVGKAGEACQQPRTES